MPREMRRGKPHVREREREIEITMDKNALVAGPRFTVRTQRPYCEIVLGESRFSLNALDDVATKVVRLRIERHCTEGRKITA